MEFDARSGAESFCLFFARDLVEQAWASVEAGSGEVAGEGGLRGFPNVAFTPTAKLSALLQSLSDDGRDAEAAVLEGRLLLALSEAVETAHRHRGQAARLPAAKASTRAHLLSLVERARGRLAETDGVGWSLEALATEVGLSRFHLLRLFKSVHGVTPIAFAERLRMAAAAQRLRSGAAPIGEVAAEFGYESPSAFAKAFRRWTGAAPSRWRE